MNAREDSGRWSPFDLSQTLSVDGGLLVPGSLPGPPVLKQLMQIVAMVPARVGGVSQPASPNSFSLCGDPFEDKKLWAFLPKRLTGTL